MAIVFSTQAQRCVRSTRRRDQPPRTPKSLELGGSFAGGFGGRSVVGDLARDDGQAVLVGVEALFAVERLEELAGGFADGGGHRAGVNLQGASFGSVLAVLVFQFH